MGREATRGALDYHRAAIEVFTMERALGLDENAAIVKAVEAAVVTADHMFLIEMRDKLLGVAEILDSDDECDLNEDGPAALIFVAMGIDEMLPPEYKKESV